MAKVKVVFTATKEMPSYNGMADGMVFDVDSSKELDRLQSDYPDCFKKLDEAAIEEAKAAIEEAAGKLTDEDGNEIDVPAGDINDEPAKIEHVLTEKQISDGFKIDDDGNIVNKKGKIVTKVVNKPESNK